MKSSDTSRAYNSEIPDFLHNRPHKFVKHVMKRWEDAGVLSCKVTANSANTFQLQSMNASYLVKIDAGDGRPDCTCRDWYNTHWPCKHILSILRSDDAASITWESLPLQYRQSPFFNLHLLKGIEHPKADVLTNDNDSQDEHEIEETLDAVSEVLYR